MQDFEHAFNAVYTVTGICRTKSPLSFSNVADSRGPNALRPVPRSPWPHDQKIAMALERNRTSILKARHTAEDYIKVCSSFFDKFQKVKAYAAS